MLPSSPLPRSGRGEGRVFSTVAIFLYPHPTVRRANPLLLVALLAPAIGMYWGWLPATLATLCALALGHTLRRVFAHRDAPTQPGAVLLIAQSIALIPLAAVAALVLGATVNQFFNPIASQTSPVAPWMFPASAIVLAAIVSLLPVRLTSLPLARLATILTIVLLIACTVGLPLAFLRGAPYPTFDDTGAQTGTERITPELVAPMLVRKPIGAPPLFPTIFLVVTSAALAALPWSHTHAVNNNTQSPRRATAFEASVAMLALAICAVGISLPGMNIIAWQRGSGGGVIAGDEYWSFGMHQVPLKDRSIAYVEFHRVEPATATVDSYRTRRIVESQIRFFSHADNDAMPDVWEGESFDAPWLLSGFQPIPGKQATLGAPRSPGSSGWPHVVLRGSLAYEGRYSRDYMSGRHMTNVVSTLVDGAAALLSGASVPKPFAILLARVWIIALALLLLDASIRLSCVTLRRLSFRLLPQRTGPACAACGYDLSGLRPGGRLTDRCPECGEEELMIPPGVIFGDPRLASFWNPARIFFQRVPATILIASLVLVIALDRGWGFRGLYNALTPADLEVLWLAFGAAALPLVVFVASSLRARFPRNRAAPSPNNPPTPPL